VLITGGEPLLQPDLGDLVHALTTRGIEVEVETNGSIEPPAWWKSVDCWSVDIKCPNSGQCGESRLDWLGAREQAKVKFVVSSEDDLKFVLKTVMFAGRIEPTILISPAHPWSHEWLHECVDFCKLYGFRLSLQLHKILYPAEVRGV